MLPPLEHIDLPLSQTGNESTVFVRQCNDVEYILDMEAGKVRGWIGQIVTA